ncbi:MAG: type IV pilus assembly protein PilM [Candidatus Zixiibacteriota bacterium]|nr:MAG: type IV pilus assembly protein PilM [candidate division Zixibacteria bacterium]
MINIGSHPRVGLDIGSHSIKIAVLEKSGTHHRLRHHLVFPIYGEGESFDPEGPKKSVVVPRLLNAFMQMGLPPRKVKHLASSIGGLAVAAKEIKSVQMTDEEMDSSLLLEARKHLPLDGSETIVDYQILGDDPVESDKLRVLLVAATRKYFQTHLETLRDIELKPGLVDIDQLAMLNSFISQNDLPDDGVLTFLNIGCKKTNLSVLGRKSLFFTRDIPVAGYAFTQDLMKRFGLSYDDAERIKLTQGLEPNLSPTGDASVSGGLALAEKNAFERLGDEINRSLRYYVKETGQSYFNNLILTGGSAHLKGLGEFLQKKFNVPVNIYDPCKGMETGGKEISEGSQLAVAIGLALRAE